MAHVTSYKIGGAIGVLKHDERSEHDKVKERKNECIDSSHTFLNYNLAAERSGTLMQHIKRVCDENNVRLSNRKDLNVMSSWVVTAPKTVKPSELHLFFKTCFDFLQNKYGEQYTLSAAVHLDETTPHMHYCFIPVGFDQKNNRLTVSSKLVLTRASLRTFHKELESKLEEVFGRKLGSENGATKGDNLTVDQLKYQSALAAEIERQQKELKELDDKRRELAAKAAKMQREVETLANEKNRLEGQIKPIKTYLATRDEIEAFGKVKMGGKILYTATEAAILKEQALGAFAAKIDLDKIEAQNNALIRRYSGIESRLHRASSLVADLKAQNSQLTDRIEYFESVLASNPQLMKQFKQQSQRLANGYQQRKKL